MGYVDGHGLYSGYYVPNKLDPSGYTCVDECQADQVTTVTRITHGVNGSYDPEAVYVEVIEIVGLAQLIPDGLTAPGAGMIPGPSSMGSQGAMALEGANNAHGLANSVAGTNVINAAGNLVGESDDLPTANEFTRANLQVLLNIGSGIDMYQRWEKTTTKPCVSETCCPWYTVCSLGMFGDCVDINVWGNETDTGWDSTGVGPLNTLSH